MAFQGFNWRPAAPTSQNAAFSFGTAAPAPTNAQFSFGASSATSANVQPSFGNAPPASANARFTFGTAPSNPAPPQTSNFGERSRFVTPPNQSQQPPQPRRQVSPPAQRMADQRTPGIYSPLAHERSKTVDYSDIYDAGEDASTRQTYSREPKRDRSPHPSSSGIFGSSVQLDSVRMADQRKVPRSYSPLAHDKSKTVGYSDIYDAGEDASTKQTYSMAPERDRAPQPSSGVLGPSVQLDSDRMADQRKAPRSNSPLAHERSKTVDYSDIYDAGVDVPTKQTYSRASKRDRSPHPPSSGVIGSSVQFGFERMTDQRKAPRSYSPFAHERSKTVDYSDIYDAGEDASTKQTYSGAPKRDRSPHPPSSGVLGSSVQLDSEREMQAKARRLARFNVELSQPTENLLSGKHKTSESRPHQASLDIDRPTEARGSWNKDNLSEIKSLDSSQAVIGLCPDMCPESERGERERKGDLDRYERLDGDRNQTSKYLAVKKYNRTAEREADLIRPMPVLQKTIDYLLDLLNQPYNDDFLNIYNFLWDRMRAIRMDLRMQHIFNYQAIVMLEQMIRLHIVAMHELCEYNKGEGFSEGFDAHLNIEQMNKTSVELFQIYDDHRKKGMTVPTEKEFRGYYSLLKLDKHPGYKVEPAELSLDLAKMTPEVRCSPDILFARDVARACRISNYIAFFRLARKATYLQACLMHAHFAKLRTQALASLHCSLQNNQGIPVTDIINWLGLEEEDVESLLEYHGFGLKKFEETYMVKEGPFLNSDTDFPTKRSHLVQLKKSQRIIGDIHSGPAISDITKERETVSDGVTEMIPAKTSHLLELKMPERTMHDIFSGSAVSNVTKKRETVPDQLHLVNQIAPASKADTRTAINDVLHDYRANNVWGITQSKRLLDVQTVPFLNTETYVQAAEVSLPGDTADYAEKVEEKMVESEKDACADHEFLTNPEVNIVRDLTPVSSVLNNAMTSSVLHTHTNRELENKEQLLLIQQRKQVVDEKLRQQRKQVEDEKLRLQRKQVADEKLRRILRKWMQQATKKRKNREQRLMLANAALNSLSIGPPFHQYISSPSLAHSELNIDSTAREIHAKQSKSWSTMNVSEVVAPVLSSTNPDAKCLCWKLLLLVQPPPKEGQANCVTTRWLLSKMMGSSGEKGKPVVSVPHLSIWRSWIYSQLNHFYTCCLSTVREASFNNNDLISEDDFVTGASSIMFHVSESIPWEIQRVRLHNVLAGIPSGARLPLLIVSGDVYNKEMNDPSLIIARRLGLLDADMTRISSFSVAFLYGSCYSNEESIGFLKDDGVREGLLWLAEHSPRQPTTCLMKTRDVVMKYLIASEEVLENDDAACNLGPNNFISIFNAALDRLAEEVVRAASFNANHWPNPEIDLLEKSSNERSFVDAFLPSIGWSSPRRIEPVIKAINSCKLPDFSDDLSMLKQGSYMGSEIEDQKLALEKSLMKYMNQSCQMLNAELAAREAGIMVQTGTGLELRGSYYYIIPRWLMIFRRIQHWRLNNLTTGLGSAAFLLEQQQDSICSVVDYVQGIVAATRPESITITQEGSQPVYSFPTRLPFDKIVEMSCKIPLAEHAKPSTSTVVVHGGYDAPRTDEVDENSTEDFKHNSLSRVGENRRLSVLPSQMDDKLSMILERGVGEDRSLAVLPSQMDDKLSMLLERGVGEDRSLAVLPSQMDDKLSMLLERCTRLQDVIDRKLSVYF